MTSATNKPTAEEVASDWIAFASYDPDKVPEEVFVRGWVLYDLVQDDPSLAWEAIKRVVTQYTASDLFVEGHSSPQRAVGNLAAGPFEDLLSYHGAQFITAIEAEARRDIRMRWTLGGVWKNTMTDEIWERVRHEADYSYWQRN